LILTSCSEEPPYEITPYVPIGTYRDKSNNDLTKYCAVLSDYTAQCVDIPVVK
jgi:hypothetical protein